MLLAGPVVRRLVSIHAPVKGATQLSAAYRARIKVSIHAPVKGATIEESSYQELVEVSIHAPVKGATCIQTQKRAPSNSFQSTRP